jgi:lipid II:glycine glycyltransferase (peptidoglycan interpeptide bridge formation enzyme)
MTVVISVVDDKQAWEDFVGGQPHACFLQSWNWGAFNEALGDKKFPLGFHEDGKLVGAAMVTMTRARRGSFLACAAGPLIDWRRPELFIQLTEHLKRLAKAEGAWFIRVRPAIDEDDPAVAVFSKLGYRDAPIHMHAETTLELDITRPEEEVLAGLRKTTRYEIRRAEKLSVHVTQSSDEADVEILHRLQGETVERHGFVPFSLDYLRKQFQSFIGDDQVRLFLAEYEGQTIAAAMIMFHAGMAVYHYGASSNQHSKVPASHLVQWEAIKEAQRRGCHTYNFWGIAKTDDPSHPWAGLTLFKRGFGGRRVDYAHARDLPTSPLYKMTEMIEGVRRRRRRL